MGANALNGIYVGVDSGGTRTNVAVSQTTDEGVLHHGSYEVSDSLTGALAPELVPNTLRKILTPLEAQLGRVNTTQLPIFVWIGAAGYTRWSRDSYLHALSELRPHMLEGRTKSIGIGNDAVTLLLGLDADGIVIAGTGSTSIVRPSPTEFFQSGGHEWVCSDYGSGFWIGLSAIREAFCDFEDGSESVLLQRLRELYGIRSDDSQGLIEKLRELAIGDPEIKKEIARFTVAVCAAAERGDKSAQNIVKSQAEELADVTAKTLRRRFSRDRMVSGLRLVQCGSLLSNSFYRASFEAQLDMRLLAGAEQKVSFDWERVVTAGDAATSLAMMLASEDRSVLDMDLNFRPAILDA